jgi:hypothetical protein
MSADAVGFSESTAGRVNGRSLAKLIFESPSVARALAGSGLELPGGG